MTLNELTGKDELRFKITYYRKKAGLTQSDVAKILGMTRSSYAYAETRAEKLTPAFLAKLAEIFDVSSSVFIPEDKSVNKPDFGGTTTVPSDAFVTTNKEQRIIKMLRMLSPDTVKRLYNEIRKEYEATMNSDD